MKHYAVLLRGINVGGKNKIPMSQLKQCLEQHEFSAVTTYIQSGNVFLDSPLSAAEVRKKIETLLPHEFTLNDTTIKALVLTKKQIQTIIRDKPPGFGEHPDTFRYDVAFLMNDIAPATAWSVFKPRQDVDTIWQGPGVIYSQRLIADITKSRISQIVGTVPYKSMTLRNWNTTLKLLHHFEQTAE